MYVAVIMTGDGESLHSDNHFVSFCHEDKDAAIQAALDRIGSWKVRMLERPTIYDRTEGYYVCVGKLTEQVERKRRYTLIGMEK